jgi:glycosyltransferase involved in cell wall biosynthesis
MSSNPQGPRLKVLHVAQTAHGGIGSYLEEIVPRMAQLYGMDAVRVVLPDVHAGLFPGLRLCWIVPFRGGGRIGTSFRMVARAMWQIWTWHPNIVHLHSTFAGFVMRPLLALMPGRPRVVYCAHGWAFERRVSRVEAIAIAWIERTLAQLCDAIVCVSRCEARQAQAIGIAPARLAIVRNGVSDVTAEAAAVDEAAREWPPGCIRLLFVGRLDRQKGVDVFYDALRELGDRGFGVVVGSSVVDGEALEPPPNVHVLGWRTRPQVAGLYAAADVLVLPSRWEGLPLVAVEAMRAGLPVVGTRVGGIPETIEDGVTGRLAEVDSPGQLAAILRSLDRPTMRSMGARGRQRYLEAFHVDRVVRQLDHLYRRLGLT